MKIEPGQSNLVKMSLTIPVAQVGPGFIVLDKTVKGYIRFKVEGYDERVIPVQLLIKETLIETETL
jgi:hypothetical protein